MKKKRNPHIGSSLNDFLKEEGILEETRTAALKEALAWQVQKAMKKAKINKVQMARCFAPLLLLFVRKFQQLWQAALPVKPKSTSTALNKG